MKVSFFPLSGAKRFKICTNEIWLLHVEQTDLCLHCFEFEILVRVCIKLGDFRQT